MTLFFALIAYPIQLAILMFELRKGWILGVFVAAYTVISMIVFDFVTINNLQNQDFSINYISFSALSMLGIGRYTNETRLAFLLLSLIIFVMSLGGPKHAAHSAEEFGGRFAASSHHLLKTYAAPVLIGLLFLNALNMLHLLSMNFDTLWHNTSYLTIKTAEEVGITNPTMAIYHEGLRILTIFALIAFFSYSWSDGPVPKFLCLTYAVYGFTIMLAGSSRWVVVYGVVTLLSLHAFNKLTWPRTLVTSGLTFILFEYAIYSRSRNDFGLSRIIPNLGEIDLDFVMRSLGSVFVNAFEGALNFANGMLYAPSYNIRTQILSLSPLPNAIDGYDRNDTIMFNPYAPMGGMGELVFFHWGPQLVFLIGLCLFLRVAYQADRLGNVFVRYAIGLAGAYAFYIFPSYSLRTTWKVLTLLGLFLLLWRITYQAGRATRVTAASA